MLPRGSLPEQRPHERDTIDGVRERAAYDFALERRVAARANPNVDVLKGGREWEAKAEAGHRPESGDEILGEAKRLIKDVEFSPAYVIL